MLLFFKSPSSLNPHGKKKVTGVKADIAIATAREFADNAEKI